MVRSHPTGGPGRGIPRPGLAVVVVLALVTGLIPTGPAGRALAQGADAARAGYRQARAAANAAEGAAKRAEARLAEVGRQWKEAANAQRRLARRLATLRDRRAQAEEVRNRERLALRAQAAQTYKFGVQRNAAILEMVRQATEGSTLARDLHVMGIVVDRQVGRYRQAAERVAALETSEARTVRRWREAVDAAYRASEAIAEAEVEVVRARRAADEVEATTVVALERLQGALADVEDARPGRAGPRPGRGGAPGAGGSDGKGAGPPPLTAAMVRARRAALSRSRALPDGAYRLRRDLVCVAEDPEFTNDYHFDRHPYRRHKGTDLFAPRGTPVTSPATGRIAKLDRVDNYDGKRDLGGISVTVRTSSGDRWYLAHLQRIAEGLRVGDRVRAGQLVGRMGTSGNAAGTPPHVHVGLYAPSGGGRGPTNPFPSLAVACHGPEAQQAPALPWLGHLMPPMIAP